MTKYLLVIIFFGTNLFLKAQLFEKIIDNSHKWSTMYEEVSYNTTYYSMYLYFDHDTIINQINYKRIIDNTGTKYGFMREDLFGKVYYMGYYSQVERIIYDFNLNIGDSIQIQDINNSYHMWNVIYVDSIYIANKMRKQIRLSTIGWSHPEIWIEGIGSLNSIIYSGCTDEIHPKFLLCYYENDSLKYVSGNGNILGCTPNLVLGVSSISSKIVDSFQRNILRIEFMEQSKHNLKIFNSMGVCVVNKSCSDNNINLNISYLPSGLYIYNIYGQNNILLKTNKIVKL